MHRNFEDNRHIREKGLLWVWVSPEGSSYKYLLLTGLYRFPMYLGTRIKTKYFRAKFIHFY
jgi:hypothetical protein